MSFERLFHPKAIAIIGASSDLTRIGGHPIKALKNAGYKGGSVSRQSEVSGDARAQVLSGRHVDRPAVRPGHRRRAGARRGAGGPRLRQGRHSVRRGAHRRLPRDRTRRAQARGRAGARGQGERRAHRRPQLPGHAVDPVAGVGRVRQRGGRDGFPPGLGVVRVPVGRLRLRGRQPRGGAGHRLPHLRVVGQRDRHRHAGAAVGVSRRCRHVRRSSPTWKARPTRGACWMWGASRSRPASR